MRSLPRRSLLLLLSLAAASLASAAAAPETFRWSVQYLIDNSQPVFGRSQEVYPRANRGLAISPDGNYLYAAFIQSFNDGFDLGLKNSRLTNSGEVRKIDLRVEDYEDATKVVLPFHRAKAVAVDDQNRVYLASGKSIDVYDADLKNQLLSIPAEVCDGVAVTREGGDLVLYATERDAGELHRFLIDTRFGSGGCKATPAGLGGSGVLKIPGAKSLRGVAVDSKDRIWIADEEANRVFRVDAGGGNLASAEVKSPMAVAFYGGAALVTQGQDLRIALVSPDLVVTGYLSVPWEQLELAPYGNDRTGRLSGIAVIPGDKGFYVANEHGQTSHQKSTYGRTDSFSGVVARKFYTDTRHDDNEPILRAIPVEVQEEASPSPAAPPLPTASESPTATPSPTAPP